MLTHFLNNISAETIGIDSHIGVCWNDTFRKIFGYNRWESVTELQ